MLDVKHAPISKVIQVVGENGMLGMIVLLTFQMDRAQEAFDLNDRFLVSVLINSEEEFDDYLCKSTDPYYLAVYIYQMGPVSLYEKARSLGLPVITDVLGEIDSSARNNSNLYLKFMELRRPDIVVTDFPLEL